MEINNMGIKKTYLQTIFCGSILMSPAFGFAASFPCDQSNMCAAKPAVATVAKPLSQPQAPAALPVTKPATKNDSMAFYIQSLHLTQAQNVALYQVIQNQIPAVESSMKNLEEAHSMLRNMALNNQYDQALADLLAQTIANNTANLALLQAQREYEIFAMLSPDQIKQYQALFSQTE